MRVRCIAHSAWTSTGRINHDEIAEVSDEDGAGLIAAGLVTEITDRQLEIEAEAEAKGKPRRKPKDPADAN